MQSLARHVYIEDHFPGVTLGAILLEEGLVQVDAPPSPEDVRTWRGALMTLGGSSQRLLVNLDAHPDRTLGARAMDCMVLAQEKTVAVFRSRPTTFKAQGDETGSDWEGIPGLSSIRWIFPELTFDQDMTIHWGDMTVRMEYHPGPATGASWVILPEVKIVFVGDAVLRNQPPFLEPECIRYQVHFLKLAQTRIGKFAQKKTSLEALDDLGKSLLGEFKVPSKNQAKYLRRLKHGIYQYYIHNFQPSDRAAAEE
jgi:glyoxylase-like metal-dependent hydrolase (beta-lactamase superfamily II)